MRFFVITTVAASVAFAIAVPNRGPLCTDSISNNPVCCATGVVGVANLNCAPPSTHPENVADFKAICARGEQRAMCCAFVIDGYGLVCNPPV